MIDLKVIVAGSRTITNYKKIRELIDSLDLDISEVVSGHANGVDKLGERYANEKGIDLKIFPADWDKYGKKAGWIRNEEMGDYADYLIAFWDGRSRGTQHMISYASSKNIPVVTFRLEE